MTRPRYPTFPTLIGGMDSEAIHGHPRDVPVTITVATIGGQRVRIDTTADKLPHPLEVPYEPVRRIGTNWLGSYWRDYGETETNEATATKPALVWLEPPRLAVGERCFDCGHVVQAGDLGTWGAYECPDNDDPDEGCPLRCWDMSNPARGYPFTEVRA